MQFYQRQGIIFVYYDKMVFEYRFDIDKTEYGIYYNT